MLMDRIGPDPRASPTRNRIYDVVRSRPGCTFLEVVRTIGALSYGHVQYHLYVLERFGFVHHVKAGGEVHYYVTGGVSRVEAQVDAAAAHSTRAKLLEIIHERPGVRVGDLFHGFPVTRQAVAYHLRYMEARGLVRIGRDPANPRFLAAWPVGPARPKDRANPEPTDEPPGCRDCRKGPCSIALVPREACSDGCGCYGMEVPA